MEALGLLVALAVIVFLAVRVFGRAGTPPSHPPLDQSWQKKSRKTPTPKPGPSRPDRTPSPAGTTHERRNGLPRSTPSFDVKSAHPLAQPRVLKGRAYVVDGDTIKIQRTQIRLFGVDAPEMNHPFGKRAKWAMFEMCKNQTVTAEVLEEDAHGRMVAKCTLPDGRDLSAELVKQGLALDWPKYSGGVYSAMETPDARKKLWLAAARQKGHMHVWANFDAQQAAKASR